MWILAISSWEPITKHHPPRQSVESCQPSHLPMNSFHYCSGCQEPHQCGLERVILPHPEAAQETFPFARVDEASEVRLDVGTVPNCA